MDHEIARDKYLKSAWMIRQEFNKNKNEGNPQKVHELLEKTKKYLKKVEHPMPYIGMYQLYVNQNTYRLSCSPSS
jgi:hypothetical protein